MSNQESVAKTITVAGAVCLVCSIIVSTAAVVLKPLQESNKALDKQQNILAAAGLVDSNKTIDELFESIEIRLIDFSTGAYVDYDESKPYNQRKAAKDPELGQVLDAQIDIAGIKRQAKQGLVYLAKDEAGAVETIVLPVHGYGLWSTLYGFLALAPDANTIKGLGFYEHAETPGLGGEVDNPKWKAQWVGKKLFDEAGEPAVTMYKGTVDAQTSDAEYKFDALSGATITSRGVQNLVRHWASEHGFGPFLQNVRQQSHQQSQEGGQ